MVGCPRPRIVYFRGSWVGVTLGHRSNEEKGGVAVGGGGCLSLSHGRGLNSLSVDSRTRVRPPEVIREQ